MAESGMYERSAKVTIYDCSSSCRQQSGAVTARCDSRDTSESRSNEGALVDRIRFRLSIAVRARVCACSRSSGTAVDSHSVDLRRVPATIKVC